jgi:arsenite methyltransferase
MMDRQKVYDEVNARYGSIAKAGATSGEYRSKISKAFGYSDEELANVPDGANLGLGCGNPVALANLKEVRCSAYPYHQRFLV